jgi:hypothetical protein
MEKPKYDVFISYSRKDTAIADKICAALDKQGISYFIDRKGIGGGQEFPEVIGEAIINSNVMLFLGSINSYKSKFTNNEVTYAFNKMPRGAIVPYIIDGSKLPVGLEFTFSSINIRTLQEHPIESTLIHDLCQILGKEYKGANEAKSHQPENEREKVDEQVAKGNFAPQSARKTTQQTGTKPAPQTANLTKPTPKPTPPQKPSLSTTERAKLYRQLGMVNAARELERQKKDSSNSWWKNVFFNYSKVPLANYVITYAALAILIAYHNFTDFYDQHPFGIWDVFISVLISFLGIQCNVVLGLCTDESKEIKNVFWGIIIVPFVVAITPIWSLIFGVIVWCLFDMALHWVDFHEISILYLYCTTAFFTLYTLVMTLIKRKGNKS